MSVYTLEDLASRVQGELVRGDGKDITGVAAIQNAGPGDLCFFMGKDQGTIAKENRLDWLTGTRAGVVLVTAEHLPHCPSPAIVVASPRAAFAVLARLWEGDDFPQGQHETCVIGSDCTIHPSVSIGPYCVINDRVSLGEGCRIAAGVIIESDASMGRDCQVHPRAVIRHGTQMGDRCIIRSGSVIGEDGFGYEADQKRRWSRVPQLGRVVLGHDVDIGAMSAIDRGALGDTVLEDGVKCDNLVQIGHNVSIGEHSLICGCVGIAGSARIGKHCILGGGSRINGHVTLVDHTVIAGASSVVLSIDEPGVYAAFLTVQPHFRWKRVLLSLRQLPEMMKQIRQLNQQVAALEKRK